LKKQVLKLVSICFQTRHDEVVSLSLLTFRKEKTQSMVRFCEVPILIQKFWI